MPLVRETIQTASFEHLIDLATECSVGADTP